MRSSVCVRKPGVSLARRVEAGSGRRRDPVGLRLLEQPLGFRQRRGGVPAVARRVRVVLDQAAHDRDPLDDLGDALHGQKEKAQHHQELGW